MNQHNNDYNKYEHYDEDGLPKQGFSGQFQKSGYSFDTTGNNFSQQNSPYSAQQNSPYSAQQNYPQQQNYGYQGMQQNIQYGDPQLPPGYKQKSMVAAALFAFFLGSLGAHNFYLGNTKKAIAQLLMCIFGYITAIILVGFLILGALYIWVIVEFVLILARSGDYASDNNGVPLN